MKVQRGLKSQGMSSVWHGSAQGQVRSPRLISLPFSSRPQASLALGTIWLDDGIHWVNARALGQRRMFCVELLLGRKRRGGKKAPFLLF